MIGDVGKEIGLPYCHRLVDVPTYPPPMTNSDDLMHFPCILGLQVSTILHLHTTKSICKMGDITKPMLSQYGNCQSFPCHKTKLPCIFFSHLLPYTFLDPKLSCQTKNTSNIVCMFRFNLLMINIVHVNVSNCIYV
jgi:hypothetical protein